MRELEAAWGPGGGLRGMLSKSNAKPKDLRKWHREQRKREEKGVVGEGSGRRAAPAGPEDEAAAAEGEVGEVTMSDEAADGGIHEARAADRGEDARGEAGSPVRDV